MFELDNPALVSTGTLPNAIYLPKLPLLSILSPLALLKMPIKKFFGLRVSVNERTCELNASVFPRLPSIERSHLAAKRSGPAEAAPPGSQRLPRHGHAEEIRLSQ